MCSCCRIFPGIGKFLKHHILHVILHFEEQHEGTLNVLLWAFLSAFIVALALRWWTALDVFLVVLILRRVLDVVPKEH